MSEPILVSSVEAAMIDLPEDLVVDPEISKLLPPLTQEERSGLRTSIEREGVRDPLVVWLDGSRRVLLDGHNRLEIARELGLPMPAVVTREFGSRAAAVRWVIENGINRRNLNDDQRAALVARAAETLAKASRTAKASTAGKSGGRGRPRAKPNRDLTSTPASRTGRRRGGRSTSNDAATPVEESDPTRATASRDLDDSSEAALASELSTPPKRLRDELAESANVPTRKIRTATAIVRASPATLDDVIVGTKTLAQAKREIQRPQREPAQPTNRGPAELAPASTHRSGSACPGGPYDLVLIDPRWPEHEPEGTSVDASRSLDLPFAKDCLVWLCVPPWAVARAIGVLHEWGFKFSKLHCWHDPGIVGTPPRLKGCVLEAHQGRAGDSASLAPSVFRNDERSNSEVPDKVYDAFRARHGRSRLVVGGHRDVEGCTRWDAEVLRW